MNEEKYIHEQHTVHHIISHIIWCPMRRHRVMVDAVAERLEQVIHEIAQENG
jgi:putative transposase